MLPLQNRPPKDQAPLLIRKSSIDAAYRAHRPHWWIKHANSLCFYVCSCSKATGPKKARTDQWGCPEIPPSLLSFFHSLSFYQEDWPSPLLHLLILILMSSSTLKSQIKTALEAEQPYEAEMKVNLRDVSVDKNPPSSSFCWLYYF